ncbi:hypothetical protein PHYBOEH_007727 [Phytophthora boehmeriae]|uniref:M96 mating-specific protein family n=1 Tax=Phytophthora boehmeriae TaxID=109152 RepID=A0A8T1X2C3_9STRA|nr:hypothetical protein PHYBOEH_007727 [Phytophthora boehmeriae]
MTFLQDDDSAQAFAATLSFLDDYLLDDELADAPAITDRPVSTSSELTVNSAAEATGRTRTTRCKAPTVQNSTEDKTKRTLINERKKLLRRAGVYGDPNRARNARREEVAYLREQLEKLQIDLQTLQSKKPRCQAQTEAAVDDSIATGSELAQIPSMWQVIAEKQRHRREEVELENVRLKLAVDRQRKVADSLSSLMRRRACQLATECSSFEILNCQKPSIVRVMDFHGDIGEFHDLFRRLDAAFHEVDAVFAANGLADMVISPSDVHIRDGVDGKHLEMFANKVLPFELRDATEATWDLFKGIKKHSCNGNLYEKSAKNLDKPYTILEAFTKEMYSNNSRADIKVKQVVRRFVQHGRDVVVWISRVSPAEIKHKVLRGLTYNLRGYAVIKRSAASTPDREVTQLQYCSLISLGQESGRTTSRSIQTPGSGDLASLYHRGQAVGPSILNLMEFLDEENAKVLEAALSFVDEYLFDEQEPEALQSVEDPDKKMDANKRKKLLRKAGVYGDSNHARNERTREIANLRKQVKRLRIDLQTLKERKVIRLQHQKEERVEPLIMTQNSGLWHEIADRQRLRREEAEHKNTQLKIGVDHQQKVAEKLSRLLQKRTSHLMTGCSSLMSMCDADCQVANVFAFHGDIGEFQGLFQQLDAAYHELDAVFEANGLATLDVSPNDVHAREGVCGKYLEFFTRKTLPFRLQDATEAAWNHFKGIEKHMGYSSLYEKKAKVSSLDEPFTIVEDFTKEVYSNHARADVRMKQVVRRYLEADRDIVIWVSHAVPIEVKHKMFLGMAYQFRGYAMTKHSAASTLEQELSELQLCSLISLDLDEYDNVGECSFLTSCTEPHIVHALDFQGDIEVFRGLFRRLHAAYRELDSVFEANGLATMQVTPSHVHVREGVDGKYMEFFTRDVLPFEIYDTIEVTWDHFKGVEKHIGHSSLYEKSAKDLDEPYTIVEAFTMEVHSSHARADVSVKQVVRRYVETDRDIVIWVSSAVPIEVKHRMLRSLAYHFRGYTVIKRSTASTVGQEASELQLCSLISLDQDAVHDSDTIRALTHFLVVHGTQGIKAHRELIENALVDRSSMAFLQDDDGTAFEAALSFVDEFAVDETKAQAQVDDAPESQPQTRSKQVPSSNGSSAADKRLRRAAANERKKLLRKAGVYKDSNHVRNERTRELNYLREQMEKLQLDLETLKSGRKLSAAPPTADAMTLKRSRTLPPGMWEEIAVRQRRRRDVAEHENVRLKLAIERQKKAADSLRDALHKRSRQLVGECASLTRSNKVANVLDFSVDTGVFQSLFAHLDAAYQSIDAVFESNGLTRMKVPPSDVHMREGVDGKYLEVCTHKVLPFGVQETTEATWDHFKGSKKHMNYGCLYEKTRKDLDEPYTVVEDFTKEMYSNSSRADVRIRQVVRRYVESDRDIVIWVSRVVPIEVKHKVLQGLTYYFRGYAVTRRAATSTPEHDLAQLQLCFLISLDHDPETKYDPETIRAVTHFLIVHAAQAIRSTREVIENALVDRSITHRLA